ncbi:41783_t:CDS:1, partial [Gigaspora margarita]
QRYKDESNKQYSKYSNSNPKSELDNKLDPHISVNDQISKHFKRHQSIRCLR